MASITKQESTIAKWASKIEWDSAMGGEEKPNWTGQNPSVEEIRFALHYWPTALVIDSENNHYTAMPIYRPNWCYIPRSYEQNLYSVGHVEEGLSGNEAPSNMIMIPMRIKLDTDNTTPPTWSNRIFRNYVPAEQLPTDAGLAAKLEANYADFWALPSIACIITPASGLVEELENSLPSCMHADAVHVVKEYCGLGRLPSKVAQRSVPGKTITHTPGSNNSLPKPAGGKVTAPTMTAQQSGMVTSRPAPTPSSNNVGGSRAVPKPVVPTPALPPVPREEHSIEEFDYYFDPLLGVII